MPAVGYLNSKFFKIYCFLAIHPTPALNAPICSDVTINFSLTDLSYGRGTAQRACQ